MGASRYVHLEDCRILKETKDAFLIEYDDEQYWIPKSQISDPDVLEEGDYGITVSVTEWIANQKGIPE